MKLRELQRHLRKKKIDNALFFNKDPNLTYFAGVVPDVACLVIPATGRPVLFVPGFEAARLKKMAKVKVARVPRDLFGTVCKSFPGKKVGVMASSVSLAFAQKVKSTWKAKVVDIGDICRDLRVVKTREEVSRIRKACNITYDLFEDVCNNMSSFKTERDIAGFLKLRMTQLGVEPSFPAIVAAGANGAVPHHTPSNKKLSGFVVFDFGVIYKNYCSDMTRTFFVGTPTSQDIRVYRQLLNVQKACLAKVAPGKTLEGIGEFARKKIGRTMVHGVGHSLGVEVHDIQSRPLKLQPGNVITIEPGTYHKGRLGIRIEDDVWVTKKGPVVLTKSSKNLRVFRHV